MRRSGFSTRSAYTIVELFVTIVVLIILFGLIIDTANRVRRSSADQLTRKILGQLSLLMDNYYTTNGKHPPPVFPLIEQDSPTVLEESLLQANARRNNADFIRALRTQFELSSNQGSPASTRPLDIFSGLPLSLYDEASLHDPWGSPIVFMPRQHPLIGLPIGERFFFFSAGPDRQFLTRGDNLYSYEETVPIPHSP